MAQRTRCVFTPIRHCHSRAWPRRAFCLISLAPLLGALGCGGGDPPAQVAVAPAAPAPAAQPQPQPAAPPAAVPAPAPVAPPPVPEKRNLPDDLAAWQAEDLQAAKQARDYRLVEAVRQFSQRAKGDAQAVDVLVDLVTDKPPAEGAQPNPQFGGGFRQPPDQNLVSTLIAALGENGSDGADAALADLLSGKIQTGVSARMVGEAVIRTMAEHWKPAYQELLITAVFAPQTIRPPAPDAKAPANPGGFGQQNLNDFSAEQLQQSAIAELTKQSTPELRKALAQRLVANDTPKSAWQHVKPLLVDSKPENLPAQIVLFCSDQTDEQTRDQLQQTLAKYSTWTLDRLLGVPSDFRGQGGAIGLPTQTGFGGPASGAQPAETETQLAERLARELWSPPLIFRVRTLLFRRVIEGKQLQAMAPIIAFAGTLPTTAIRATLASGTGRIWKRGPELFKAPNSFPELFHDPGDLLAIKTTPRQADKAKQEELEAKFNGPRNNRARPRKPAEPSEEDKIKHEWMDASEQLVRALNERFHAASASGASRVEVKFDSSDAKNDAAADTAGEAKRSRATTAKASKTREPAQPKRSARAAPPPDEGPPELDRPEDNPFGTEAQMQALPPIPAELPLELHSKDVTAEYHLNWPAELAGKVDNTMLSPLVVHYVRFEQKERLTKVAGHYFRQLKGAKQHYTNDGRWIDFIGPGSAQPYLRSVDVIVTTKSPVYGAPPPQGRADAKTKNPPEDLIVEILSIETVNPRRGDGGGPDDNSSRPEEASEPAEDKQG